MSNSVIDLNFITKADAGGRGRLIVNGESIPVPVGAVVLMQHLENMAKRYIFLNSIDHAVASSFFWEYQGRQARTEAIDKAMTIRSQACNQGT